MFCTVNKGPKLRINPQLSEIINKVIRKLPPILTLQSKSVHVSMYTAQIEYNDTIFNTRTYFLGSRVRRGAIKPGSKSRSGGGDTLTAHCARAGGTQRPP